MILITVDTAGAIIVGTVKVIIDGIMQFLTARTPTAILEAVECSEVMG
jgi:hypothetical protein